MEFCLRESLPQWHSLGRSGTNFVEGALTAKSLAGWLGGSSAKYAGLPQAEGAWVRVLRETWADVDDADGVLRRFVDGDVGPGMKTISRVPAAMPILPMPGMDSRLMRRR